MLNLINGPKGLKILICDNKESSSVSLLVLVGAGSDWENKKNNGIFHFIEHLYFKGSKNFPNAKILLEAIDDIGGSFNAFTSHEYTGYYIKVLPEYSFEALKILSDIILNPLFPEDEIERERKVIFEEINLYQDRPQDLVIELGHKLSFGDQPAGWSILGTKNTIAKINRKDILQTIADHYSSKNTIIVLSGKIENQKKIIDFIFKAFGNYNSAKPKQKPLFKIPKNQYKENILFKESEQANIFLGFPLPGIFNLKQKRLSFRLLSIILGEKASSRLWLKIREELGAAYSIKSYFSENTDRSLFFVYAGLNLDRLEDVFRALLKEIVQLKKEGPSLKELETSKAVLKSSLFMDLEESLGAAIFYGRQYILEKKIKKPQDLEREIDKVKINDLKKELNNLFSINHAKLAVILPKKSKINFKKIFQEVLK